MFKSQQQRERVVQKPARERASCSKASKRESELFKIQQERERDGGERVDECPEDEEDVCEGKKKLELGENKERGKE